MTKNDQNIPGNTLIEIYSKPGCHLCDIAKEVLMEAKQKFEFEIREINIENDEELFKKYQYDIPVIRINGRKAYKYKIDPADLQRRLAKGAAHGHHS
jgi:glutaredoxin